MSREKINFPTTEAYQKGRALLRYRTPVYVRNEKWWTVAARDIPSCLRSDLADLGATITDERFDAESEGAIGCGLARVRAAKVS